MNRKSIKTMCLCCMTYHIYVQWGKSKILISKNQCDGARAYPIWFLLLGDKWGESREGCPGSCSIVHYHLTSVQTHCIMTAVSLTVCVSIGIKVWVILRMVPWLADLVIDIGVVWLVSVPEWGRGWRRGGVEGRVFLRDNTFIITGLKKKEVLCIMKLSYVLSIKFRENMLKLQAYK